jgi:hypothetical protein
MKLRHAAIALTLFAAFASDSRGQSKQNPSKASQQKTTQQERGTEDSPVVVKVIPTEKSKSDLDAEKAKQESDRQLVKLTADLANYTMFLFFATAALFLATIGLVVVGFRQVRDAKRSINAAEDSTRIAERALTELERPFVAIEIIDSGFKSESVSEEEYYVTLEENLTFKYVNHGRSPATIIETSDKFDICTPHNLPDPIDPNALGNQVPFGVIVGANGGASPLSTREQSRGIDKQEFMRVTSGDDNLVFIGYVRFRDIFNRTHVTGFCLRLSRSDARFYFAGDHRYNYTYVETQRTGPSQPT